MHIPIRTITFLCWLTGLPLAAETTTYQTAPKSQPPKITQDWQIPVISIDPATEKTRVFIQSDGSFGDGLASRVAPVYHARALYEPASSGISDSIIKLHRQMADACPQGWIKRQEWAILQTDTPELHYQFQCLNTAPQD